MSKLWEAGEKRIKHKSKNSIEKKVEDFTVGNDHYLDNYLLPYDLKASGVHLTALKHAGILSDEETAILQDGLNSIYRLWKSGEFEIKPEHEDGHTAIELWLTEQLGDLGKKIHTGRSRNDQVLTAVRLYEKDQLKKTLQKTSGCAGAILQVAKNHERMPMPGYTHTRKAMLSSVGQWLAGFAELLIMQLEASPGVMSLTNRSPLGTAAGFGTTIQLDRDSEAKLLGFEQPIVCATSAQLSRGWVELQLVHFLFGITNVLARLSADIVQFSSEAFQFIEIAPELCTGSSIMPNKKNPDVAELIRGKHSLMAGYAANLQAVTTNLGAGYHRDLQLTKEPVILAFETASEILDMSVLLVQGLSFNEEVLKDACSSDLLAAELTYKLVKEEGLSFREAYKKVKNQPASTSVMSLEELFAEYSQLGSPGNPGIDRLIEQAGKWLKG